MSNPRTIKRLVTCFGSIQLVTALSVLSYREQQQELNSHYENYLLITPLFAPPGQDREFAVFIEKMAKSLYAWERVVYIPLEQKYTLMKKFNKFGLSRISSLVHELLGSQQFDEIYLSHEYDFEDQLLMNVYSSAEKICYGNGIGIYTYQSAFALSSPHKNLSSFLNRVYASVKKQVKSLLPQKHLLDKQEFDLGYFSLPSAFGQVPRMKSVVLDRSIYLETFQKLSKKLSSLIDINYINNLQDKIQSNPTSILLTSNFSEAAGRMSLDNEIAAYREFLETQGICDNSILLIKPHPRDSKQKILQLKSALSDLYAEILLLTEDFLFYLPFELLFMEICLNPDRPQLQTPRIFTFSSACLTLELILNVQCDVGFGSDLVQKFFYQDHIAGRIEHEADLLSTIQGIRNLSRNAKFRICFGTVSSE